MLSVRMCARVNSSRIAQSSVVAVAALSRAHAHLNLTCYANVARAALRKLALRMCYVLLERMALGCRCPLVHTDDLNKLFAGTGYQTCNALPQPFCASVQARVDTNYNSRRI